MPAKSAAVTTQHAVAVMGFQTQVETVNAVVMGSVVLIAARVTLAGSA